MTTASERFFVDKRVGCLAVRDRTQTNPDDQGLNSDTDGVIQYWPGIKIEPGNCPHCNQRLPSEHAVRPEDVEAAERLCRNLNRTMPNCDPMAAKMWPVMEAAVRDEMRHPTQGIAE